MHCLRIYALLHVLLLLPPDPEPCQRRPIPTLASLPAPAFFLFLPLLFLPLSFYLHLFPSPPVFLHRDKFKARLTRAKNLFDVFRGLPLSSRGGGGLGAGEDASTALS